MLQALPVRTLSILCESVVLIKQESKWKKANARLMCWQGLNFTLKFTRVKDPDHTIETIAITTGTVVEGPDNKDGDKRLVVKIKHGRKTVEVSSESTSMLNNWVEILKGIISVKIDPQRCGSFGAYKECIQEYTIKLHSKDGCSIEDGKHKQKLEDIKNNSAINNKTLQNVKLELTKLRPTHWLGKLNNSKQQLANLQDKILEYRDKVFFELLSSEHSYVLYLTILLHVFKNLTKKFQKDLGIEDNDFDVLFCNLEEIVECHNSVLENLVTCFIEWDPNTTVLSNPLKRVIQALKIYNQYAIQFDNANNVLIELSKKSLTKSFFELLEEDPLCKNLTLPAFLIMPIQRIPRYLILLDALVENTATEHVDYPNLLEVRDGIKSMADEINSSLQKRGDIENTRKIIKQFDKIKEWRLTKPGRVYLHQGELTKQSGSGNLSNNYYFLFSDSLVSVTKISDKWTVKSKHVWETLTVEEDLSSPIGFIINTDKSSVHFLAKNDETKTAWLAAFARAGITQENVAFEMAPLRLAATKECLICLKSFNQLRKRVYCRNCRWVICRLCCKSKLCDYCDDFDVSKKFSMTSQDSEIFEEDLVSEEDNLDEVNELPQPQSQMDNSKIEHGKYRLKTHLKSISFANQPSDKENAKSENKNDVPVKITLIPSASTSIEPNTQPPQIVLQPVNDNIPTPSPIVYPLSTNKDKVSLSSISQPSSTNKSNIKEIDIYKKIISIIYQNDAELRPFRGTLIPAPALSIWNMLASPDLPILISKSYIEEIISAIKSMATKTKLTCMSTPCYWLSCVCALCCMIADSPDPNIKQLYDKFNSLFFTIYLFMVEQFKTDSQGHLINIFIKRIKIIDQKPKVGNSLILYPIYPSIIWDYVLLMHLGLALIHY